MDYTLYGGPYDGRTISRAAVPNARSTVSFRVGASANQPLQETPAERQDVVYMFCHGRYEYFAPVQQSGTPGVLRSVPPC
jgi:hypothetical protein